MHWCGDETMLLMTSLPVLGYLVKRVRTWWSARRRR